MGLILMGEAVLSKSLILFSVDWWSCVPSLLFNLGPNYGGGNEYNGTSFKRSHAHTAALSAPNSEAGHLPPMSPLETPGHSHQIWVSLFWGHCSFLLCPGMHKVLFVTSKNTFPQCCVTSGSSLVVLMAISFKRVYAIPRSAVSRAPAPAAGHC